jgi:hypothetical protein
MIGTDEVVAGVRVAGAGEVVVAAGGEAVAAWTAVVPMGTKSGTSSSSM